MVWTIFATMAAATGLCAANYSAEVPMAPPDTPPAFADEFDGAKVDKRVWRFDTKFNRTGWFNNELQYYADARHKNTRVEGGVLTIEAHREDDLSRRRFEDWGGQPYTSGKLVSRKALGYGFYEISAKLPCGRGTWPAIWLLPEGGQWPDEGEIDVMEMVGWDPNVIHGTLHSGTYNHRLGTQRGAQATVPTACTEFHRYQLDWQPDAITIGVDGTAYMRVTNDAPGDKGAWPFTRPYHLILNLAIGGDWGGKQGVDDAALPQSMAVDYVRYWPAEGEGEDEGG